MRTSTHLLGAVAGIAAALAFEGWTTSAHGVRSATHYAAVDRASMLPKGIALAFYNVAYQEANPQHAAAQFLARDFVYHADGIPSSNGAQWLSHALQSTADAPRTTEQVVADGDIVMIHYVLHASGGSTESGVDIFRIQDHQIAELWAVRDKGGGNVPLS